MTSTSLLTAQVLRLRRLIVTHVLGIQRDDLMKSKDIVFFVKVLACDQDSHVAASLREKQMAMQRLQALFELLAISTQKTACRLNYPRLKGFYDASPCEPIAKRARGGGWSNLQYVRRIL